MLFSSWFITGCGTDRLDNSTKAEGENTANTISGSLVSGNGTANSNTTSAPYNRKSRIADVMADLVFGSYGRLLFPVQRGYWSGETLEKLRLTYYNYIDSDETVTIVNYLHNQADNGKTVFYDIYTDEEKSHDPRKADTGLFFFRGNPGARFAVCNAGGAFAYVGAMHDSFPHAFELSKKGYNAFALIYRPGAQTACEDLARAISFILPIRTNSE